VPLIWMIVLRAAGSSSPEFRRRRCPSCAAARRRRRHGILRLSSLARARRFGGGPAANGAPQRREALAPPLAGAAPPLCLPRRPHPTAVAACARSGPSIPQPAAQIAPRLWSDRPIPVNPNTPTRIRSWPLELDPVAQIHLHSFNRALLLKKP
jgi:hypothetical protein